MMWEGLGLKDIIYLFTILIAGASSWGAVKAHTKEQSRRLEILEEEVANRVVKTEMLDIICKRLDRLEGKFDRMNERLFRYFADGTS
jgi:hypothetical protein